MSDMADVLARRNFEDEQGKGEWDHITKSEKRGWLKEAQATLDFLAAAGFGLVREAQAVALEEAADDFENLPTNKGAEISSGTWDWFELFPIEHLRARAVTVRGGE